MKRFFVLSLCLLVVPAAVSAQVMPERELEIVKSMFNAGNYREALTRSRDAMAMANFSEAQRVELHKIAGLSAYNLGERDGADRHFLQLLQINPDFVLDPFAVAPPAIKAFEEVKRKNADALNLIRQNIALREEQLRREAAERERQRLAAETERKRIDELTRTVTITRVDHQPFVMNFMPFGIGQFVQDRTEWGVFFAVTEAVTAVLAVVGYIAIELLYDERTIPVSGVLVDNKTSGTVSVQVRVIPPERRNQYNGWRIVKWSAAAGFGVSLTAGILDAIFHHQGDVTSTTRVRASDVDTGAKAPQTLNLKLDLFPVGSGGGGIGLSGRF